MVVSSSRRSLLAAAASLLLTTVAADAGILDKLFAPAAQPWPRWEAHSEENPRRIDHAPWDRFLAGYRVLVKDGIARVAYGRVSEADRASLEQALAAAKEG